MPEAPPFGLDLPEGTILADPASTSIAIRMGPGVFMPWFIISTTAGGSYSGGWECRDWEIQR